LQAIGVIPARFASTRFPGKPLKLIQNRPLIQWVVEGAKQSRLLSKILVATDHPEIFAVAERCGAAVVMTSPDLPTGSDRVFAATREMTADVIVNIQGDEPLIKGSIIDALVEPMLSDLTLPMATLGRPLRPGDLESPHTTKIALNRRGEALYFSRLPIPCSKLSIDALGQKGLCLNHIGLYAFRKSFLAEFCAHGPTPLELAEGLEQLRALYLGARIKVVEVDHLSVEVNVPDDVARVEAVLKKVGQ